MLVLVKDYYYDPRMKGANSIQVLLPTVLQTFVMPREEKDAIIQGFLHYCELDTLAMVMIFEGWRE